jgi:uncharacterized protein (DUF2235 family)
MGFSLAHCLWNSFCCDQLKCLIPVEQDAGGSNVGKNVVVCCDGKGNQFGGDYTNVVKLYLMLVPDRWKQVNYYHAGLGTMPFVPTRRNVMSQGLGLGIQADIMDVYTFLIKNYEPGDRLLSTITRRSRSWCLRLVAR